jgi:regulator of vacuolar morphogenesis
MYFQYTIEIGTKLKSYTICRRYSQFERLSEDLMLELDPATSRRWLPILPPKSTSLVGYLTGSGSLINQPSKIAERQAGLERWLKTVIVHKELKDKTSKSRALMDFLEIPSILKSTSSAATHKSGSMDNSSTNPFTSQSWLAEHNEIRSGVREMYDLLSRRDELLHQSTSTSVTLTKLNQINVDAKRHLENITARLGRLTESLKLFTQPDTPKGRGTLTEGETSRRMQLISTLQDDCERLSKKILARAEIGTGIRQANQVLSSESASRDRAELLGTRTNGSNSRPTTRVLGGGGGGGGPTGSASRNVPAEETGETRQRDNRELMDHQLHHVIAQTQDDKLKSLTQILSRQKLLGLMINQELAEQNEILDDLDRDVDSASRKLKDATKKINRLT